MPHREEEFPSYYSPGVDFVRNPGDHLASHLALAMAEEAKRQGKRMMGQLAVETDHEDLNVMFTGYGNGDCYCWFVELNNFILIAHIDDRWKCLGYIPVDKGADFQSLVNEIANSLNIKHGYPVEMPDDFKPRSSGDENEGETNENPRS